MKQKVKGIILVRTEQVLLDVESELFFVVFLIPLRSPLNFDLWEFDF